MIAEVTEEQVLNQKGKIKEPCNPTGKNIWEASQEGDKEESLIARSTWKQKN